MNKIYTRTIDCGKGIQTIEVLDKKFISEHKDAIYGGIYVGFMPNEFEVGKKVPHGFFSKYEFKQVKLNRDEQYYAEQNF